MADRTEDDLRSFLEADGFRFAANPMLDPGNRYGWYAYRRSAIPARECECNDGKPAQIVVFPFCTEINGFTHRGAEVEVCGQASQWFKLRAYSIQLEDLPRCLHEVERRLIAAWNALAPESNHQSTHGAKGESVS